MIRTFAPFVAGIGKMSYLRFLSYNLIGGILWMAILLSGGYLFGNLPLVRNNFTFVILAIIFISISPGILNFLKGKQPLILNRLLCSQRGDR